MGDYITCFDFEFRRIHKLPPNFLVILTFLNTLSYFCFEKKKKTKPRKQKE